MRWTVLYSRGRVSSSAMRSSKPKCSYSCRSSAVRQRERMIGISSSTMLRMRRSMLSNWVCDSSSLSSNSQ